MSEENKIQLYRAGVLSKIRKVSAVVENSISPEPESDVDFHYVLRVVRERYRTILAVAAAVTFLALVVTLFMKPVYRSQATIEVKGSSPEIETLQQLQSQNAAPNNVVVTEVETEIGILKSDRLARKVVDKFLLSDGDKLGILRTTCC